jgi:RHS repeat-associated protein
MKTIYYFFVFATIFFNICATKIGFCQSTNDQQTQSISAQKIVDEISLFIDDDTAIVCYVNLLAVKDGYKLVSIAERLAKVESFHERMRHNFTLLNQSINKKIFEQAAENLLPLIEHGVTHLYVILNMRDLKFGAYFVIPDVQENSDKAKCIEGFFNATTDDKNNKSESLTWSVFEKNYMIVGGQNPVLTGIVIFYIEDEQMTQMLLMPQFSSATCRYYNLLPADRRKYINERFKNFKPSVNKKFQLGIEEVTDCNFIKAVFLFPDSVVAWEFMHLKKMDAPLNQTTFDFLKSTRDYVAFGIDNGQPKIKLTVQCKSPEDAVKFKKFIDDTWRSIINNYFVFFFSQNIQWRSENDPKPMSPSDLADFFVSLLPRPKGNKLVTVIDQNYTNNILKNNKQNIDQTRFDSGNEFIITKNQYDLIGRFTNISHVGENKTIYADYDLKWDNANRITDFDFTYLNGPAKRNESKYAYDKTSQLINANYNFMQSEQYNFDPNGNRKTVEIQGQKQNYKTGEYNRLLSDENYSYEYDHEGNRISKTDKEGKVTKYFWDNRNRLIKVQTSTATTEYIYDYLNRLVQRKQGDTETIFVHDDWQIVLQFGNENLKPTHRYLWGTIQDELICDNNSWVLGDHINTIRDTIKSDGIVTEHLEYDSFGKLISEIKNNNTTYFAYTSKLTDKSSDLQWNVNRWYDSNIGRWMREDPIGFESTDNNLYRYSDNCAIDSVDFNGNFSVNTFLNAFIYPGNFEINFPFIWGTQFVGTVDITSTDNNCCLNYQLKVGVSFSIRNQVIRILGRVLPRRIQNFITQHLPDVSVNIMALGDLGKLYDPFANQTTCQCITCSRKCEVGLTGGVGIGNTNRGGGRGENQTDLNDKQKRSFFSFGASGVGYGTYDFCSGNIQVELAAYFSIAINLRFFAYNRNITLKIFQYP